MVVLCHLGEASIVALRVKMSTCWMKIRWCPRELSILMGHVTRSSLRRCTIDPHRTKNLTPRHHIRWHGGFAGGTVSLAHRHDLALQSLVVPPPNAGQPFADHTPSWIRVTFNMFQLQSDLAIRILRTRIFGILLYVVIWVLIWE